MLIVFECHLDPNRDDDDFLSAEVLSETQAQVMTAAEALAVGFEGIPNDEHLRLVAVAKRDKGFMEGSIERAPAVLGFRVHEIDG